MRVDGIVRILIQILHEKKVYSSSLKLNIYYVCQYPKKLPNELHETLLYTRIRFDRVQKKSPERYQCIRKQEKSIDTQALAVKTQKLNYTICHKIQQKSPDGYSSPRNKTKHTHLRRAQRKSTEAENKSPLAYAFKKGTKQNSVRIEIIY
jgi:hypothetical protein